MTLTKTLAAATALAFMAGSAFAAPCNTGSTAKAPDQNAPATSSTANGADKVRRTSRAASSRPRRAPSAR